MLRSLLVLAAVATAAPATAEPMTVLPNGLPVAHVSVEGHGPFRFIIDTGASSTAVLPALHAALPVRLKAAAKQNLHGAGGAQTVDLLQLDRLGVGGRLEKGLRAFNLPDGPVNQMGVHGVLGADVLARYELEMDVPGRRWSLREPAEARSAGGPFVAVPFDLDDANAPRFTVLVDGKPIAAMLDTGARGTIINWAAARALGVKPSDPDLAHGASAQGATSGATTLVAKQFGELRIGELSNADPRLMIGDLPFFAVLGLSETPGMILGIDQLSTAPFVVDYGRRELRFSARSRERAGPLSPSKPGLPQRNPEVSASPSPVPGGG